ncbi:MAG: YlbF family regulator [Clostridia bacterium]|nr:YlbF family regulator [Clostridia bacterium]
MTEQIMKAAHALGDLIKNDPVTAALNAAMEDYERSEELMALIGEYNAHQELMMSSAEAAGEDENLREKLTSRMEELYNNVVEHPVYKAYNDAKEAFDALYTEVMGEIQFGITGERPCAHDCSSCGGCH